MASLAKRVGVSAPTINDWEKGVIKNIEGANLLKVASVLGVTATFLLTGKKLTKDGELVPQISDNDGLGELSQEELDLIHAWRSWTDDTRNVVRSIMQHTGLQGHPLLEVAKKANPDDQLRANRALEQAQAKLRAKMPSPRAADKRKT
jgi:transcriptional regulator with XRE-family HTH domain